MAESLSPEARALITSYDSLTWDVRQRVERFVRTYWAGMGSWRTADIEAFIRAVVPVVESGQLRIAALTDAYLAALAAEVTGIGAPSGALVSGVQSVRGVPPAEVYTRPGVSVWTELASGKALDVATDAGLTRALHLVRTDLQLAKTHTARAAMSQDTRISGYRRTLTGQEDCGLCLVASTQRYHKEDLLPIHPGCDCGVEPVFGSDDPGQIIDPETLDETHAAIAERFGIDDPGARLPDYRKVLLVREHGEIGPVLTVKLHRFTGENAL